MSRETLHRTVGGALAAAALALAATPAAAQYIDDDDDRFYDRGGYSDAYDRDGYSDRDYADREEPDDVTFFHDELADHGRWISHSEYGYVWTPRGVDDDWRPYSRGHWANTDDHGWYWVSEEPFGWATYHYGRWFHDSRYGWLWVPGTTWGPAWVAWRYSDDYVGWAPLPPDAQWDTRSGLRYDAALYESPRFSFYWSFIEPRYIATPNVYRYCAPRHRARTIIYRTRPVTRYDWRGDHIVNAGVSVDFFSRHLASPLGRVNIFATTSRAARGYDRRAGNTIRVWRPDFRRQYHAGRPHHAQRSWGNGFWSNVDRRRNVAHRPGAEPPRGRPLNPGHTWGLPPSGRSETPQRPAGIEPAPFGNAPPRRPEWETAPRQGALPPPAVRPAPGWNRDGPRDGRRPGDARPNRPPPAAATPPPAVRPPARPEWDRGDREGRRDGWRPGDARPARPPPVAATPSPAVQPPVRPGWDRGDRDGDRDGRPRNGARPRDARPDNPPPVAATPPPAPQQPAVRPIPPAAQPPAEPPQRRTARPAPQGPLDNFHRPGSPYGNPIPR